MLLINLFRLALVACAALLLITLVSAHSQVIAQPPHGDIPIGQQTCNQLEHAFVWGFMNGGVMGETAYGVRAVAVLRGCPWATP